MTLNDFIVYYFTVALIFGIIILLILVMTSTSESEKYTKRENFVFYILTALTAVGWPILVIYLFYLNHIDKDRIAKNKRLQKMHLTTLNNVVKYQDPAVNPKVIGNSKDLLFNITTYMPNRCEPTYRDTIQVEWYNKNSSYMEFEIYNDCIKCMIVPYFYNINKKSMCLADLEKIAIHKTFNIDSYKQINQIIENFIDEVYDEKCDII